MNEYIYLGKIVNTHGIKGEIRIISECEYLDRIFKPNNKIYIGEEKVLETINTYRHHKIYEMITLKGITNINDVLKYKGQNLYFKKVDLNLSDNEYLISDLIGLNAYYNNKNLGAIIDILNNNGNILLVIKGKKLIYIPKNDHFIKSVDFNKKIIELINIEGLI